MDDITRTRPTVGILEGCVPGNLGGEGRTVEVAVAAWGTGLRQARDYGSGEAKLLLQLLGLEFGSGPVGRVKALPDLSKCPVLSRVLFSPTFRLEIGEWLTEGTAHGIKKSPKPATTPWHSEDQDAIGIYKLQLL